MAGPRPDVPYTPYPTTEAGGGGGSALNARATPADFGGQVGAATEKLGQAGEQVGNDIMNVAIKQQGMINETMATNAEADYLAKTGSMTGSYKSLGGLEAVSALPKYTSDIQSVRNSIRSSLPGGAAKAFDLLTVRHEGYYINDANTFAAAQIRKADYESAATNTALAVTSAASLPVAQDDHRFGEVLGDIKANTARQFTDAPGIATDPKTGTMSFDESTSEGKSAKQDFTNRLNQAVGLSWENRINTLSNVDLEGSYNKYLESKDQIPRETQIKLEASFAPKITNAQASTDSRSIMEVANQEHRELYLKGATVNNPTGESVTPSFDKAVGTVLKNEGGYNPNDGGLSGSPVIYGINASAHPAEYAEAKKISDEKGDAAGQQYAKDFYKKNYWDAKDIGSLPANTQTIVMDGIVNHSTEFGNKLIQDAKNGATPQQLIDERRAEYQRLADANPAKYAQNLAGWNSRLDNLQTAGLSNEPGSPITQQKGPPLSQADYYRSNYSQILDAARTAAEQRHPGDVNFSELVYRKTEAKMNDMIRQQELSYKVDNDTVMKAFNGDFSKGARPTSVEQLVATSPDVKAAWEKMTVNQPQAAMLIESRILAANAKGSDRDTKEYGKGFYELFRSIHAPEGSPDRITNPTQLYSHVGEDGDLTMAGLDKLTKEMNSKSTPEDAADGTMKTQNLKVLKTKLSGEEEHPGIKDPKGEELYARALPLFFKAVEDGKAKGIPTSELYNPASKNWAGSSALGLVRDPKTYYADLSAANSSSTPVVKPSHRFLDFMGIDTSPLDHQSEKQFVDKFNSNKLDAPTGIVEITNAVKNKIISQDTANKLAISRGYFRSKAESKPVQTPIPGITEPE